MKHKYTRTYFLREDSDGNETNFGAEGIEEFKRGGIREQDLDILQRIEFCDRNVLDLGFGRGEAIKYALDHGARSVIGVDFSDDANTIARKFLAQHGLTADLYCMDALNFVNWYGLQKGLPRFDIVLMLDFVEHVPRSDLTDLLTLTRNLVTDCAILAINTPVFQIDNDVIEHGLDPRARDTSDDNEETTGMHCNRYTRRSLHNYLKTCGFIGISGHFFIPNLPNFSLIRYLEKTPLAWGIACRRGYPVARSALWQKERFEYAMSGDQIRKNQNSSREEFIWIVKNRHDLILPYTFSVSQKWILSVLHYLRSLIVYIPRRILHYYRRNMSAGTEETSETQKSSIQESEPQKTEPHWFTVNGGPLQGHTMLLSPGAPAHWNNEMLEGRYDSFIYDVLDEIIPVKGATIWDVGAHIGYHSLAFAALAGPSGHVVAFEPNHFNIDRLRQHLEKNPDLGKRITLMTCALSSRDGEEKFIFSSEIDNGRSSGSHLDLTCVPERHRAYELFSIKKVPVFTADTLLQECRVPVPSIIKIDIEGAEALFLAGAQQLLTSHRPVLLIEVHHITTMHDTLTILLRMGYQTKILNNAPNSSSRCFIVALPENGSH